MKKKCIILVKLIVVQLVVVALLCLLSVNSFAATEINLTANKEHVDVGEEFCITVNADGANIAAYTLWVYFDSQMVDCVSNADGLNVIENRAIYTWFSEDGVNKDLDELVQIKFKAKQDGVASFAATGEFYNQNGEQIEVKYNQVEVGIGDYVSQFAATQDEESDREQKKNNASNENKKETTENVDEQSANKTADTSSAKLEIMRLNQEGVNPDFNPDIHEYYLIVDEDTEKLDITAVPENRDAEVKITGNKNLKNGLNKIEISVTSVDKSTTADYIINVTKTDDSEAANADLENLAVENYTLSPDFQSTVTSYTVEISNEDENLNILAIAQNENAKVKISGNHNLKIGQNEIVITVTAPNGITEKNYIIHAYRRSEAEESTFEQEQQNIIEQANEVMEQMGEKGNENMQGTSNESDVNSGKATNAEDTAFMIVGIVLSIIVIGIVVIRIKADLKQKK